MDYQHTLNYIYSFVNYETRPAHERTRAHYTLDRIRALLAGLGDPHRRYPTVHIAGTKGKGSTAAMVAAALRAAGYRTGLFTSPHLHTYRERIQINGQLIQEEAVVDWIAEHRGLLESYQDVTTFEVTTALGFDTFAREGVDIAVVEVGLGGRLDTTNVITPRVSVITSISLDHTAILGDTIAEIAWNKAGIIKPEVPVVSAPQYAEALDVLRTVANDLKAPLGMAGQDWMWKPQFVDMEGQGFEVRGPNGQVLELWIPLLGAHQLINATLAVAALDELRQGGFSLAEQAIRQGLQRVRWPGRLEILSRQPLVVADGAHNDESARRLLSAVHGLFGRRRIVLVFGASGDKNIEGMLEVLLPATNHVITTQAQHPRAANPYALAERVQDRGHIATTVRVVSDAVAHAVAWAGPDDLVLVTGSLFVVAEAREAWFRWHRQPLPPRDPPRPE